MDHDLLLRSLNFHGQQLLRVMEEKQPEMIEKVNLKNVDYHMYHQRVNELSLQDRSKRVKLFNFIAKKSKGVFRPTNALMRKSNPVGSNDEGHYGHTLPLDTFMKIPIGERRDHWRKSIKNGDIIVCLNKGHNKVVGKKFGVPDFMKTVRLLYMETDIHLDLETLGISGVMPRGELESREWKDGDLMRCEVLQVSETSPTVVLGHRGITLPEDHKDKIKLGYIIPDEVDPNYKLRKSRAQHGFEASLKLAPGFYNPTASLYLAEQSGLLRYHNSFLDVMQFDIPASEYSTELRRAQSTCWAYRSVAQGVSYFKAGKDTEAFQCLNQALNIDPENVEAFVARGALYANKGSFLKALDDFDDALKLSPTHGNAKKYRAETLMAQGKESEDEKRYEEALQHYRQCLEYMPEHPEALSAIRNIHRTLSKQSIEGSSWKDEALDITDLESSKTTEMKEKLKLLLQIKAKKKKGKRKKKQRKKSDSSSSSSASGSSSESSSSSSWSTDSSSSTKKKKHSKKSKSSKKSKKSESLSPLSKKLMKGNTDGGGEARGGVSMFNPSITDTSLANQSAPAAALTSLAHPPSGYSPHQLVGGYPSHMYSGYGLPSYEFNHLHHPLPHKTREEQDYEEKVRRFLEQTTMAPTRKATSSGQEKCEKNSAREDKKLVKKKVKKEKKKKTKAKDKKKKKSEKKADSERSSKKRGESEEKKKEKDRDSEEEYLYGKAPDIRDRVLKMET